MRKDFNYLGHVSVEEIDINCRNIFMFSMNNLAVKGLTGPLGTQFCEILIKL